jgi:hypothetical protein
MEADEGHSGVLYRYLDVSTCSRLMSSHFASCRTGKVMLSIKANKT